MSVADQLKAEGRVEGLAEGRVEGLAEGRSEGLLESLMLMLDERFGDTAFGLRPRLQALGVDHIRSLITISLRSNSVEEIEGWLDVQHHTLPRRQQ